MKRIRNGFSDESEFELQDCVVVVADNLTTPGFTGQLHVLGLNNDYPSSDNINVFHYSVPSNEKDLL